MGDEKDKKKDFMKSVFNMLPSVASWIHERLLNGETEAVIERDIADRRAEIAARRLQRDQEFRERFGRDPVA